jgi:hypothetical protein
MLLKGRAEVEDCAKLQKVQKGMRFLPQMNFTRKGESNLYKALNTLKGMGISVRAK